MSAPQQADQLLIPLLDGTGCLAVVLEVDRVPDGHMLIGITSRKVAADAQTAAPAVALSEILSITLVPAAPVPGGDWRVIGFEQLPRLQSLPQYTADLEIRHKLTDPVEPAVVEAFANACFGLYPWDGFPDPQFFDRMLRQPDLKPILAVKSKS